MLLIFFRLQKWTQPTYLIVKWFNKNNLKMAVVMNPYKEGQSQLGYIEAGLKTLKYDKVRDSSQCILLDDIEVPYQSCWLFQTCHYITISILDKPDFYCMFNQIWSPLLYMYLFCF